MKHCVLSATVAIALFAMGGSKAPAVTIDDFTVGPYTATGPIGPIDQIGLDANHTIGSVRRIILGQSGSAPNTIDINTTAGRVDFATGSGPGLGYLNLIYGATSPLNADLTSAGHDRIRLVVNDASSVPVGGVSFAVSDTVAGGASYNLVNAINVLSGGGGIIEIPYSGTVDFTKIKTISLNLLRFPVQGTLGIDEIVTAGSPLAGDFNRDGHVDIVDFNEWKRTFGRSYSPTTALLGVDGNGDGVVNQADYTIWRDNLGAGAPGSAAATPEPHTLAILAIAVVAMLAVRRRTR